MATYSSQVSESVFGYEGAPTTNYGTNAQLSLGRSAAGQARRSWVRFPNLPSGVASVTSAQFFIWCASEALANARVTSVFRCKRPWVENQLTWNVYATGLSFGTAGGGGAADYDSSLLSSVNISATIAANAQVSFVLDNALLLDYLNNQATYPGGFYLWSVEALTDSWNPHSNDAATSSYRPVLSFDYTLTPTTNIKSIGGVTYANTKTVNGVAIASVKSINGLT